MDCKGTKESFWDDGSVLRLPCGSSFTGECTHQIVCFKWVHFIIHKLSKFIFKKQWLFPKPRWSLEVARISVGTGFPQSDPSLEKRNGVVASSRIRLNLPRERVGFASSMDVKEVVVRKVVSLDSSAFHFSFTLQSSKSRSKTFFKRRKRAMKLLVSVPSGSPRQIDTTQGSWLPLSLCAHACEHLQHFTKEEETPVDAMVLPIIRYLEVSRGPFLLL